MDLTNAAHAAFDGDGDNVINLYEWITDTDPMDRNSFFSAVSYEPSNSVVATFPSSTARVYSLEYTEELVTGAWQQVNGMVDVTGSVSGTTSLTDTGDYNNVSHRVTVTRP